MTAQLFWALMLPTLFVGLLVVGAFCIEHLIPPRWIRRTRKLTRGRAAQKREYDAAVTRR